MCIWQTAAPQTTRRTRWKLWLIPLHTVNDAVDYCRGNAMTMLTVSEDPLENCGVDWIPANNLFECFL
jgi:hypothetical protein